MKKIASFWDKTVDGKTRCGLCSHSCVIDNGGFGVCGVRKNEDGELFSLIYGLCSSVAVDPIEKKPLYHFHPGSEALSLGTVGCNFKCLHCQNFTISTASPSSPFLKEFTSEEIVELAKKYGCEGLAWTYNEPTIWYEFSFDTSKIAKKNGFYNVYVTNGYIKEDPLREISPYLNGLNVDIKAFTDDFYKKVCKARLRPVLETCKLAKELGLHLEVTYLIIPGYNDSSDEIKKFCKWYVNNLGESTPLHFSRFHPDYKMTDVPVTPMDTLTRAYDIARENGILYTYLGNVPGGDYDHTICPKCGNICIKRRGFSTSLVGIKDGRCSKCGNKIPIVF